jgi:phage regulator Rha-like protein
MNRITISEQDKVLVVDSRIIAEELGIEHETFLKTIKRFKTRIESTFGCLGDNIGDIQMPNGGIRQQILNYWLTEDQSTVLMTMSKNTERVINCKFKLVKAFSEAKKKLQQPIEPTTQPILPVEVNQSKVFIVGDDNGVKALVPHDQIEKLLEIATLRKFKQTIDPIMFEGLDPACLALPLELIEALNEQLQIAIKLSAQKSKPLGFGKSKKPKNK